MENNKQYAASIQGSKVLSAEEILAKNGADDCSFKDVLKSMEEYVNQFKQESKGEIKMADLLMDFLRFHYRENPVRKYATNEKEVYKFLEENPKWLKAHKQ